MDTRGKFVHALPESCVLDEASARGGSQVQDLEAKLADAAV